MTFDQCFQKAFDGGLADIKFFVRRDGIAATPEELMADALAFQEAIDQGNIKPVDSVDQYWWYLSTLSTVYFVVKGAKRPLFYGIIMLENIGNLLREYHNDHGININETEKPPIRTALLHPYIETRGVVDKILLFEANIETTHIVAQVQKFQGETNPYSGTLDLAHIYYAKNHNYCWRRFGVCKEMFHCMIDKTMADRVASIDSLKTLLELLAADNTDLTGNLASLDREEEAELLALETLFPMEFRQDYFENPASQADINRLSMQFKIPAEYVKWACCPTYNQAIIQLRGCLQDLN